MTSVDRPVRRKTLADFGFDGRAVLTSLVEASPWGSLDQGIASLSVFASPDVVLAAGQRAIFRTIRGRVQDRGEIVDGLMFDDNTSPALAFKWCTELKLSSGKDVTCCHLYSESRNADAYTDLRNLFYAPSFISKLTDSQAASLPPQHALHLLRYRAFKLFGYCGPGSTTEPPKPEQYDNCEWADTVGEARDASELENRLRQRLARKPKDRITKSVTQCGWAFSDGRPDTHVVYRGG